MRTGVQWRQGEITMHVNIEQTIMIYLNGKANNPDGARTGLGPDKIVTYDAITNKWIPWKPNATEIQLITYQIDQWYKKRHMALTPVN